MKCPFCSDMENKVVDSRLTKDGMEIRRRRECQSCEKRFTTYERIEEILPMVVKKDGRREPFDRVKILSGVKKACDEFFADKPEKLNILIAGNYTSAYFRKSS